MSVSAKKLQPRALRNVSVVSVHKGAQIVGQIVAVATIPRLLGAEDNGRFAFVLSLAFLGQILGDFGTLEVMSRFVPTLSSFENRQLYTRTVAFKLAVGLICGLLTVGAGLILSQWMQPGWAVLIGLGVFMHIVAWVPFQHLLGKNRVGLWMVEQSWRQWALVILLLVLYPILGFGGTIIAWTIMEAIFLVLGLWWARHYWQRVDFGFDWNYIKPYVRFGFGFFLANLIGAGLYRSGPILVETITGQSAQAGYLSLAIGLFLMPYLLLTQLALSLVPTLSRFYNGGQLALMQQWIHNFVRYSWIGGWLAVVALWFTVDLAVLVVFGSDFVPAASALKWVSLGIPLAGLLWAGNAIATVTERGRVKFIASLITLTVFLGLAFWLIPSHGADGAAAALTVSILANVLVLVLSLRPEFTLEWPLLASSGVLGIMILIIIAQFNLSVDHWGLF